MMSRAVLELDDETGVTLVRDPSGTYVGYVDKLETGWFASRFAPRDLRHYWTGGTHVDRYGAVLALGLSS